MWEFLLVLVCFGIIALWAYTEWKLLKSEKQVSSLIKKETPSPLEDNLAKLVKMMREERDTRAQEMNERVLLEHIKSKHRNQPPVPIKSSMAHEDEQIHVGRELIPYNLSPIEKEILKEFNKDD